MSKPFTDSERRKFEKIKKLVIDVVSAMDNEKGLNIKRYK